MEMADLLKFNLTMDSKTGLSRILRSCQNVQYMQTEEKDVQ